MSITTTCPYCNAVVPMTEDQVTAGRRVPCPRCGEAFPTPALNGNYVGPAATATVTAPSSTSRRQRNRLLGVGLMIGMLALAGIVALLIINTRDKRRLTFLAESEALGYLPDDTNVIASLNYAEAGRTEDGKEVLDRAGFDLERFSGLMRDQIEAGVIGLRVDNNIIPRMRVVIRTRSAIDFAAVRAKLDARSAKKDRDREYFPFLVRLGPMNLEFALWSPTPHTLVAVYPVEEVNKVPATPNDNPDRFAAPIAELLRSRAERDSFLWLVAHSDDWTKTSLKTTLPVLGVSPDLVASANHLRTFGLALRKDTGVTASRARPARITQDSEPDPHAVWLDLVLILRPEADVPALVDGLEAWADRQKLTMRDANRDNMRYSATLFGTPEDWSRALESVMKKK